MCANLQLEAIWAAMAAWVGFHVMIGAEWLRRCLLW